MKLQLLLPFVFVSSMPTSPMIAAETDRPNILYFYVDDMGWGSIGPNGQSKRKSEGKPYVRTPNIDSLARQGVNFTRGYGCHVCSPARSSQQSGFHQGHTFADRNDPNNAKKAMRADDILIGDALSAAGYVTGYWGKWGYGGSKDRVDPVIDNVQTLPTSHGYQHVLAELHHVRAHTFFQPTLWSAPARTGAIGGLELVPNSMAKYQGRADYPGSPALQNHPDYPPTAYCDDAYAFAALDFVRRQGQNYHESGQPFFGLLAVQIPHAPFGEIESLPDWDRAYADDDKFGALQEQSRQWAAMVTRIDAHFGNILAALEDPNNDGDTSDSIKDNTLVIFQSDNGGPGGKNHIEFDSNGGLQGVKGKIQEGGIRVPLVMRWPAMITERSRLKAGSDCDMIVDVTDLLPTFCELADAPVPLGIDGVSIAPTLRNSGHQRKREFIIHEAGNGQSIIRGNHKLVRSKKSALALYDLESDHSEANNIAEDHPDLVKQLESLLLGERVDEPKGFANTYHHWTGRDGAKTSEADNWSDYVYSNAGITYMADAGPPRLSWIAKLGNTGSKSNAAHADANLECLGLEVRGNGRHAKQSLVLAPGVDVTGRNEIRLASHGSLVLNGGSVRSLRWVEIHPDAVLRGHGSIRAEVYNDGIFELSGGERPSIDVSGDYHQSASGMIHLRVSQTAERPAVRVHGDATIDGMLQCSLASDFRPKPGKPLIVFQAKNLRGRFSNPNDRVVAGNGIEFTISYSDSAVMLIPN